MPLVELVHRTQLKTLSRFSLQLLQRYFRIEIHGLENIPKTGPAIIAPNHSGFLGADAVLLTYLIKRGTKRRARILAHRGFFDFSEQLKDLAESMGLRKASIPEGVEILNRKHLLLLFPEGEAGNFKTSLKRYQLQPFHTGFLRMAIQSGAPIVPCAVIGAEEASLNLGNIDLSKFFKGIRIPLPLNLLPLPAKWRIIFLPPVKTQDIDPSILESPVKLKRLAAQIQKQIQKELKAQLKKREYIFTRRGRELLKRIRKPTRKKRTVKKKTSTNLSA